MNHIDIIGRLTRDPEIRVTKNGNKVCNFRIAWEDHYKGEKIAHYYDCNAWSKLAENVEKYCSKGSLVGVEEKLKTKEFENKNGIKINSVYIECDKIDFLSSPKKVEKEKDFTEEFNEAEKKFNIMEDDIQF